jgi:hypothetical protein
MLAKRLAAHWGLSLDPEVSSQAASQYNSLLAEFIAPEPADMSHFLLSGGRYSIDSDS